MSILKIKRLHPQAQLPARATDGSAGHDLYACIERPDLLSSWRVGSMWR